MPTPVKLCPHCRQRSCYHCWTCGARINCEDHKPECEGPTRPYMPPDGMRLKTVVVCVACADTGKNSKGLSCYPCTVAGRLRPKIKGVSFDL